MANDVIVIEYQANINKLQNSLNTVEKDLLAIEKESKKSMGSLSTESKKAASSVDKVDKQVNGLGSSLSNLSQRLPFAGAIQEAKEFGGALKDVGSSTASASKGMSVLRVATMAALGPIALIIVAITTLIAFFKRTDDGATKLEGVLGALNAALNELTGWLAEVGSGFFDALSSMDGFKKGIENLGNFIVDQIKTRYGSMITFIGAVKKAIDGDFAGAVKQWGDSVGEFVLGVENITDSLSDFFTRVSDAAQEAYNFALAMDAISDAQRDLNVQLSENRIRIIELIRQSKNHSLAIQDRIKNLREANKLDEEGLTASLKLEEEKLKLLKDRNLRELASINQSNAALVNELKLIEVQKKTTKDKKELDKLITREFEIKTKLLSINDNLAQEEADQQIKINNMKAESVALQERNNAAISALVEQGIQEELQKAQLRATKLENIQKEHLLKREINEEQFAEVSTKILIASLEEQKQILEKHGKDTTEIEKAILDAQLKTRQKHIESTTKINLKILDESLAMEEQMYREGYNEQLKDLNNRFLNGQISLKEYEKENADFLDKVNKETLQRQIENDEFILANTELTAEEKLLVEKRLLDAKKKLDQEEIDSEKEKQKKRLEIIKAGANAAIDVLGNAASAVLEIQQAEQNAAFENQQIALDKENESALRSLEAKKEAGLISEAEFNASKEKLDQQRAKKEAQLKTKQFKAEQQAKLNMVKLDTASAVIKTFAQYGFTPFAAIAVAALLANAAIQTATIQSTPVPKFEKGGKVDGKSHRQGGVIIEAEGGEWIVDKHNTGRHQSALEAMSGGYFDKFVNQNYVVPAMRKAEERDRNLRLKQANTAENIMNALSMNGMGDMSHLERLTKSNKKVIVQNLDSLPRSIGKELERAISNKNYIK